MLQSEQYEVFRNVTEILRTLDLKYYVTGSFAIFLFGEMRLTNDIDIVVDLPMNRVAEFAAAFDSNDYYLSEDAIRDAVTHRFMFNIIYLKTMTKLDFMLPKENPFDRECLIRAAQLPFEEDCQPWVATAEDVALNKMLFYKEGGSEKHIRDITSLIKLQNRPLDHDYVRLWAGRLDVLPIWESILQKLKSG